MMLRVEKIPNCRLLKRLTQSAIKKVILSRKIIQFYSFSNVLAQNIEARRVVDGAFVAGSSGEMADLVVKITRQVLGFRNKFFHSDISGH